MSSDVLSLLQDPTLHLGIASPQVPLCCDTSLTSLVSGDPSVLGSAGQRFCRLALCWNVPDVFLMISLALWVWGGDHRGKVPFSSHHTGVGALSVTRHPWM